MNKLFIILLLVLSFSAEKVNSGVALNLDEKQEILPDIAINIKSEKTEFNGQIMYLLTFTADVPNHWYIYSTNVDCAIGPLPPSLGYENKDMGNFYGNLTSTDDSSYYDDIFDCTVAVFTKKMVLNQYYIPKNSSGVQSFKLEIQCCNNETGICLPYKKEFKIDFN